MRSRGAGEGTPKPARSVVAIASGKGGVGKSTVALNLALALAETGAAVGILDADVFAPDIPLMVNVTRKEPAAQWELVRNPAMGEHRIEPVERYGIRVMSSALILGEETPLTLSSVFIDMILRQFLHNVEWGYPDYLIVDLPPGTADLQQTVVRTYPLTGGIVVVTPQDVAHLDARKVVSMYRSERTRILGGVENFSSLTCEHCGKGIDPFPRAPQERTIWAMGVEQLGAIPMDPVIGRWGNAGAPALVEAPDSAAAWAFRRIADRVADAL